MCDSKVLWTPDRTRPLAEVIRIHQQTGRPLPTWIPQALESWLSDVLVLAAVERGGSWSQWARRHKRQFQDAIVADHIDSDRDEYGLTWKEAADETAHWFSGTCISGGPDKMIAAYKRDRNRGLDRPWTCLERYIAEELHLTTAFG